MKAWVRYVKSLACWMIISVFTLQSNLEPSITSCLKECQGKKEGHRIRNVDFVYMINLDQRPEKYARALQELAPYGIVPYRFSAVNGWELSLQEINTLGITYNPSMTQGIWGTSYLLQDQGQPHHEVIQNSERVYFCHTMARGAIGIVLSHLSILEDAYNSGFNTVWILEDDVEVIQNPHLISDRIEELDRLVGGKEWDILFTDQDSKDQKGRYVPCYSYAPRPNFTPSRPERFSIREDVNQTFRKIGARYGAYSYIMRRSGMEKILKFIRTHKIFLPYDIDFCFPDDIRLYCVRDDIVSTQPNALSDNGAPNYKSK